MGIDDSSGELMVPLSQALDSEIKMFPGPVFEQIKCLGELTFEQPLVYNEETHMFEATFDFPLPTTKEKPNLRMVTITAGYSDMERILESDGNIWALMDTLSIVDSQYDIPDERLEFVTTKLKNGLPVLDQYYIGKEGEPPFFFRYKPRLDAKGIGLAKSTYREAVKFVRNIYELYSALSVEPPNNKSHSCFIL